MPAPASAARRRSATRTVRPARAADRDRSFFAPAAPRWVEFARLRATGDPDSGELRCRFCREEERRGDCLGLVGALNHQVLNGARDEAERLVRERLRGLAEPSCD